MTAAPAESHKNVMQLPDPRFSVPIGMRGKNFRKIFGGLQKMKEGSLGYPQEPGLKQVTLDFFCHIRRCEKAGATGPSARTREEEGLLPSESNTVKQNRKEWILMLSQKVSSSILSETASFVIPTRGRNLAVTTDYKISPCRSR